MQDRREYRQKYTYNPPKIKNSTKEFSVFGADGEVVCNCKRTYKVFNLILDHDTFVHYEAFAENGKLRFEGKKIIRMGRTQYKIVNKETYEEYHVSCKSWQSISPEFIIKSSSGEYNVKKEVMDWARFYYNGKEVARWKMKPSELFKCYLEIEHDSPIKDPGFFTCLFQLIFYVGG